jgi:predicted nuclease with TOPRIM domain
MAIARKISNITDVHAAIKELELKTKVQETELKSQIADVRYQLEPKRVLRNTFSYLAETPEIQKIMVNTAIGFIVGFASKKAAQFVREESLNRSIENIVNDQLTKLENKEPGGFISKAIALFRTYTPPTSPIYPLIRYR